MLFTLLYRDKQFSLYLFLLVIDITYLSMYLFRVNQKLSQNSITCSSSKPPLAKIFIVLNPSPFLHIFFHINIIAARKHLKKGRNYHLVFPLMLSSSESLVKGAMKHDHVPLSRKISCGCQ